MAHLGDPPPNDTSLADQRNTGRANATDVPFHTIDRFERIPDRSNFQPHVVSLITSCIDQDKSVEDLRFEVSRSLHIEDITSEDVLSNSDLFQGKGARFDPSWTQKIYPRLPIF